MHTPGPWTFYRKGQNFQEGIPIWDVWCEDELIADLCTEDNARLIAAAPKLLEALEGLTAAAEMHFSRQPEYLEAKAAIAEAKGE